VRWARLADAGSSPAHAAPSDATLERQETLAALRTAIEALPARARLAVVLRWHHGMTNAEVADAMGISVKGVEKLLASAMERLRVSMRTHRGTG
jgi:RNA polymerase sigma factor (sigma-70 family)